MSADESPGREASGERRPESGARALLLVNPGARTGRGIERVRSILRRAPDLARRAEIVVVRSAREIGAAIQRDPGDEIPVAAGGDGTVNMLVSVMREAGLLSRPIGLLPLGTGNAFAHAVGVGDVRSALLALQRGVSRAVDIFATTHPDAPTAVASISAGVEANVLDACGSRTTWRRWVAAVPALIRTVGRTWTGISVAVDGEPFVDPERPVYNAGLYNLPCYGFGWKVFPDADSRDGEGEAVVCASRVAYWKTLFGGLETGGRLSPGDPRWQRWRTARFETRGPLQIDGEVFRGGASCDVTVLPRALHVLVPPGASRIENRVAP